MQKYKKWVHNNKERNLEIARIRREKRWSFEDIGELFGLSRATIEQICSNLGVETFRAKYKERARKFLERDREIFKLRTIELWTLQEIADKFGLSRQRIQGILGCNTGHVKSLRTEFKILSQPHKTNRELSKELDLSMKTIGSYRSNTCYRKEHHWGINGNWLSYISKRLNEMDVQHERICDGFEQYILIYPDIKICARVTSDVWNPPSSKYKSPMYRFRVDNTEEYDFIVFVIDKTWDCFIVPRDEMIANKTVGFCWPLLNKVGRGSIYRDYHERWDLLIPD